MNTQALMNSFGYCQLHDVVNKTEGYSLKFPKSISILGSVISIVRYPCFGKHRQLILE